MILQLIIFAVFLCGISYVMKRNKNITKHRQFMGLAVILQAIAIVLIMGRSFLIYFDFIVTKFYQLTPMVTWIHGIVGGLAEIAGIIFLIRHPRKIRRWMQATASLWVTSLAFGTFFYAYYYL